jgi:hypothetical protein
MKGYILAQLAFWVQQVLVVNIEERRKDYWQMLTHHFVTISLMYGSYRYGYTPVGNLILVLMDVVDLFLPVSADVHILQLALTNFSLGRQVLEVPWLQHALRLHVWCFYGVVVFCTPRLLPDGVLFSLLPLIADHGRQVLHGATQQYFRAIPGSRG